MTDALDTWHIADRINRYLLDALTAEDLAAKAPDGKGRSVGEQLAHLHNVRLLWLKSAAPALAEPLAKSHSEAVMPVRPSFVNRHCVLLERCSHQENAADGSSINPSSH
jgi:uncharacterized damage-inducible protein DinB